MYIMAPVENSQELGGGDAAIDNTLTGKGDHVSSKNERNTYEQKKAFEFVTQNTERLSDIFNRVIEQLESNSGAENFKFETNLLKLETNISIKFWSLLFLGPRTIEDRSAEGIFIHFILGDSSEFQFLASIEKHLKQGLTKFVNVFPMLEFRSVDLYEIATEQLKGVARSMSPTSDDSYSSKPQLKGNLPVNDFKNILNGYENSRPTNGDKNGDLREKRLTQRINECNLLIDNLLNKRSDPAKGKQVKCNIGLKREDDPEHREQNEKDTTMRSERIVIAAVHGNKKRQTISKERESATLKEFFDSKPPDLEAQNSYEVGESLITSRNSRELRDDERHSTMCQEQQLSPVHVPQNSNAGTGQQQDSSEEPELGPRQHFAVNLENSGDKEHHHGVHSQPHQDVHGVNTLQYQNTNTEKTVHQSVNSEQQHDMSNEKEHDMDSERLCSVKHKQQNGVNNEQEHSENTGQQHTEQYNAENTGQQHTEQYNAVGTGQQNDVNSQQQHGANKEQHYSDNTAEQPNDDMVQELRETIAQKPWPQCMEDLWIRETAEALRYFGKNKFRCIICNNPTHCPCCRTSPTNEIPMECMQDLEGNRGDSSMQNDGSIIENTTSDREDHHFESITAAETAHHSWDFDQTLPMKRVSSNIASNRNGIHEAFAMSNKNMLMRLEECFSTPYGKTSLRVCNECEGASESHHESPDGQPTQHCNESEQQLPLLKEGESLHTDETSHEEIESNECESIQSVSTPLMTRSEAPGIPVQRSMEAECPSDGRSYRGATRDVNCHHDCSPSNDASMSSTTSQNHQSRNLMDTVQNLTIDGESDTTASANTSPSSPLPLPVQATTNHESILEIIDGDNVMNQLYSNVRPEHSTLTIFDDDPRPTNAHWPHSQLRFAREQTGQLISHMSRSSGLQTRVNRLNSRPTTVSVFRTNYSPSGFERRQRDVEAGESFRSHLQSRTQGASTLSSNFPLEEAHEAGSLPPWAAREPSVDLRQAASPAHINLMRRCASFSGWPSESGQCPRVMALAGFYYSGEDRRVNCFYCGLILDSWSPSDDPWDEHARYRPSCQYLLKMRGQQFITQAQIRLGKQGKPPV